MKREQNVLAIDAGNTHIRFAHIELTNRNESKLFYTTREKFVQDVEDSAIAQSLECIAIATVVRSVTEWLPSELEKLFPNVPVVWCDHTDSNLLTNHYSETLGIDRFVDAVAALDLYPNQDLIIIDSGTATTVDMVTQSGEFLGGYIIPGLGLKAMIITKGTDKLPPIDPYSLTLEAVPQNTMAAIEGGLLLDCAGGIEKTIDHLRKSLPKAVVIACGGGWELIKPYSDYDITTRKDLTLRGTALLGLEQLSGA